MALTTEQQQVLNEVGDPNGTIAPLIPTLWTLYTDKASIDSRLTALYAKWAALGVRQAEEYDATDVVIGKEIADKESARFAHVDAMRTETHQEIVRVEARARARRVPQSGALTAVEPTTPPYSDQPDASDPLYQGSPYSSSYQRW